MNAAYSYLWRLPVAEVDVVKGILEELRQYAIQMGAESVGDLIVLTDHDAHMVSTGASHIVMFNAVLPTVRSATLPTVGIEQYGLASSNGMSWEWSGVFRVTSFREIGEFMDVAARLGIAETHQTFGGMVLTAKRNFDGELVYNQQYVLQTDLENF